MVSSNTNPPKMAALFHLVSLCTWNSYSTGYCLSTLPSEKYALKVAASHRHLCRTVFRNEVSAYIERKRRERPHEFIVVRSTVLYKAIAPRPLLSVLEQYTNAQSSLNTRLNRWLEINFS